MKKTLLKRWIYLCFLGTALTLQSGCASYYALKSKPVRNRQQEARNFPALLSQAEAGDLDAGYRVAEYYEKGIAYYHRGHWLTFMKKNPEQSRYWYQATAERGESRSLKKMRELAESHEMRLYWFQRGDTLGDPHSQFEFAQRYEHYYPGYRDFVEKDYRKALHYYQAVAQNDRAPRKLKASAYGRSGWLMNSIKPPQKGDAARSFLQAYDLDPAGNAVYLYSVAQAYLVGYPDFPQDLAKAQRTARLYFKYMSTSSSYTRDEVVARKAAFMERLESETLFAAGNDLPKKTRADEYKTALAHALRAKDFNRALLYFDFLDRIEAETPTFMLYFRGIALMETGDSAGAKERFGAYVQAAGENGRYHADAINHMAVLAQKNGGS